jgi:sugar (pentulose or hexulose) kinase
LKQIKEEAKMCTKNIINDGGAVLGIEFGSTRIKAILVDDKYEIIASGDHEWENRLEDGVWTYSLDDIWDGLRSCYKNLASDVEKKHGTKLKKVKAIGFSAMMHGYMAFDKDGKLLVPFRTWRNTITGEASEKLTALFDYHIPQRWSIAHLYQAILNGEEHVGSVDYFTTLAGYIHWQLTGKKVIGIGDASGMFPIDPVTKDFDAGMIEKFDAEIADKAYSWKLKEILPQVLSAGEDAGVLTEEGAKLLDESGNLEAGSPICPPEGDAGTGMAATNSVAKRTGNVSAGTSVFAMVVLEDNLKKVHEELDMVTTPDGSPVAMVHVNNCTSDLNAWVNIFREFADAYGIETDTNKLFGTLYKKALEGDADCGGLLAYGYLSGEHITGVSEGRPLFARSPQSNFTLANFMRTHLYTAFATLKIGMDILIKEEEVKIDSLLGHGGIFKTAGVAQGILASALDIPVSVMTSAGEGGAWGMALLAAYLVREDKGESLESFLKDKVFAGAEGSSMDPDPATTAGFEKFIETYKKGIAIELAAGDAIA